jgi:phytoene dehydrogenase-like protein
MSKKVLIIGGGIAGLTAGCYLQKNGFVSEIYEAGAAPGGLCTSWKRGEYTIDGCLHWLVGSNPNDPIYDLWNELIDMGSLHFHNYQEFFRVRDKQGKEIVAYTNLEKLHRELLAKAPEDTKLINEFIGGIEKMKDFPIRFDKAPELITLLEKFKDSFNYFPYLWSLVKFTRTRIKDFAQRCKNPLLSKFFEYSFASEMPMLFIMITFAWLDKKTAGYPVGGSLQFSRLFEKKYLELDGRIHYDSTVKKIITKIGGNGFKACGIELENGEQSLSDIVISAADGYSTIFKMLGGKFIDKRRKKYFENYPVFPSFIQVTLGVNLDLGDRPSTVAYPLDESYQIDPEKQIENMYYRILNYDPTLAPEGKTLISCMVQTYNYKYWVDLRNSDYAKYKKEKERIASFYIERLDEEIGGIKNNLEMVDVSTPATVIRYTNNWKGSFEGWMITRETGFKSMPKELPGLKDFFMTGHWVEPGGGVPAVFFSGRNLVQVIKKKYS